jgi:hypothetical protein
MKTLVKSFLLIIIFSLSAGTVIAQNTVDLIVSPPNQEINLNPGEEKEYKLNFIIALKKTLVVRLKKLTFLSLIKTVRLL